MEGTMIGVGFGQPFAADHVIYAVSVRHSVATRHTLYPPYLGQTPRWT